jgi:hypothetical protein
LYPPVLHSVDVVWNPFDDIVPRQKKKQEETTNDKSKPKVKK